MNMTFKYPISSSSAAIGSNIWLCDYQGDIYFLRDTGAAQSDDPPISSVGSPNWIKVDSGFKGHSIVTGYGSIVCAVKDTGLYFRMGITFDRPMGRSWSRTYCDVKKVVIGKNCVVRQSKDGHLFTADMTDWNHLHKDTLFMLNWDPIPPCVAGAYDTYTSDQDFEGDSPPETREDDLIDFEHIAMDETDQLYGIEANGKVYMYKCHTQVCAEDRFWYLVTEPPKELENSVRESSSRFSWLPSLWGSKQDTQCNTSEGVFCQVCAGRSSLWCLRSGESRKPELWQLVLSEFRRELKTNWVKSVLPAEDSKLLFLCADRGRVDRLLAVFASRNKEFISYSLNQKDCGRLEIPFPCTQSKDLSCVTIALAKPEPDQSPSTSLEPISKKPREPGLCCENGDCGFCRSAAASEANIVPLKAHPKTLPLALNRESAAQSSATSPLKSFSRKRPRSVETYDGDIPEVSSIHAGSAVSIERGALRVPPLDTPNLPKSARLQHPTDEREFLLEGIEVVYNDNLKNQFNVVQADIICPITPEQLDTEFNYLFTLEHTILQS